MADELPAVTTYPRDAVLTTAQLAAALQVSSSTIERMDLPYFRAGNRVRYVYGQVVDVCAERAKAMGAPAEAFRFTVRRGSGKRAAS